MDKISRPANWRVFENVTETHPDYQQMQTTRDYVPEVLSDDQQVVFPAAVTGNIFLIPGGSPLYITYTTSSQQLERDKGYEFVCGLDLAIPYSFSWAEESQVQMFFRIQVDFDQPIIDAPSYLLDFEACLDKVHLVPFSFSHTTKQLFYCFSVVGVAKVLNQISNAISINFSWNWQPDAFASNATISRGSSTDFWISTNELSAHYGSNVEEELLPSWLFRERYTFSGVSEKIRTPGNFEFLG